MKEFHYLTFDCYGTLIDWKRGIEAALRSALGKTAGLSGDGLMEAYLGAEKAEESSYKKYREVLKDSCLRVGGELGIRVSRAKAEEFASSVPAWPAFEDTGEALRALGRKGYRRYILSNVDTDLLRMTIRAHRLEVDGFVTAEETKSYKPAPGHWAKFLEKTGAKREEVLHVAQSLYHDVWPAERLGFQTAWVNRYGEALPRSVSPLYVTDSLKSLEKLLE